MANFPNQVLTNGGKEALGEALAGKRLRFVRMAVGDGEIASDADLLDRTELVNHVTDIPIVNYRNFGDGKVVITGSLRSVDIEAGFFLREVGMFCTLADDEDNETEQILYSLNNAGDAADYIPGKDEQSIVIQLIELQILIDRASRVEVIVIVGEAGLEGENIGTEGAGVYARREQNKLFFKRLVGEGITETDDRIEIVGGGGPSGPPGRYYGEVAGLPWSITVPDDYSFTPGVVVWVTPTTQANGNNPNIAVNDNTRSILTRTGIQLSAGELPIGKTFGLVAVGNAFRVFTPLTRLYNSVNANGSITVNCSGYDAVSVHLQMFGNITLFLNNLAPGTDVAVELYCSSASPLTYAIAATDNEGRNLSVVWCWANALSGAAPINISPPNTQSLTNSLRMVLLGRLNSIQRLSFL